MQDAIKQFNQCDEPLSPADAIATVKIGSACQQALATPTKINIDSLKNLLEIISHDAVRRNQTRLLLTLLQLLSNENIKTEVKLRAILCLSQVLEKAPVVSDFFILRSIIQQLMQLLYDPELSKLVANLPEEFHLTALQILTSLLKNLTVSQQNQLYSLRAAPFLGVLVCLCLEEADKQQFRKIKIAAIECLMACGQVLESPPDENELFTKTANIFMNFVPGVVKGLKQVICANEKQGHAVVVVAVRAWGRLIAQVMDNPAADVMESTMAHESLSSASNVAEMQMLMEKNTRNKAYFKMADQWLKGNVEAVCEARSHSHHRVRMELVSSAEILLIKCSKNLPSCVVPLLEVLVALSEDEISSVSDAALKALSAISTIFEEDSSLVEVLETNLFRVADSLPAAFSKKSEAHQISSLELLAGYLRLLGPRLCDALHFHCHIVLSSLTYVATFDCSHVVLLEDASVKTEPNSCETRYWMRHTYFNNPRVSTLLKRVCRFLSKEKQIVVPQLLAAIVDKPGTRKESVFLINQILNEHTEYPLAKSVIQNYLDPAIWDVALNLEDGLAPADARSNSVLACLLCEGLAVITASTGQMAPRLLSSVLYPVLERAGSTIEIVSLSGCLSLSLIADALGYQSSASLICNEAHYFTHHVAVRLRRVKDNPGALLVLCAVLRHGPKEVLPYIELIIRDVLLRSQNTKNLPNYGEVFLTLIANISQWQEEESDSKIIDLKKDKPPLPSQCSALVDELILYHKIKKMTFSDDEEDENAEDVDKPESKDDAAENEKCPLNIQLTETVLLRCLHMLPSRERDIQILALRVLRKGLPILALHENQLLPLIHKLWSPLVQRFSPSQDVVVLRLSFELLCVAANLSKSFIRHRCLEQVLPSICQFLEKQSSVSLKQRGCFSQSFKLQKSALDQLGPLAIDLELQEEDIHLILKSSCLYLNSDQPLPLQESCRNLCKSIANMNCDAVWLRLHSLWSDGKDLIAPTSVLSNIRLPLLSSDAVKYKKNVELLLQSL